MELYQGIFSDIGRSALHVIEVVGGGSIALLLVGLIFRDVWRLASRGIQEISEMWQIRHM